MPSGVVTGECYRSLSNDAREKQKTVTIVDDYYMGSRPLGSGWAGGFQLSNNLHTSVDFVSEKGSETNIVGMKIRTHIFEAATRMWPNFFSAK